MNNYLDFAKSLALKGGKILRDNFGKLEESQIHLKGAHDVVTEIDKKVEAMYADEIKKVFPDHGIIGEEGTSENPDQELIWVLDPLDGTKNYSIENPFFCTSICLLQNKDPIISVIHEPITDNLYYATKGEGAFVNGKPIHVSKKEDMRESMILYCHAAKPEAIREAERYVVELKLAAKDAARLRSAGSEMALVAKGACEAYLMNQLPLWDLAAGALLVREAGGKATDFEGNEWRPESSNILVSNGSQIHGGILEILNTH